MNTSKVLGAGLVLPPLVIVLLPTPSPQDTAIERGEYVFRAAGGCTCHHDPASASISLAGGRPIATPFGTIYSTNITPDDETGIGGWSSPDFMRAMRKGESPEGEPYYPVFPYTSFTRMTDSDLLDLKAYLSSLEPVAKENKPPELRFPYNNRNSIRVWRALHFELKPFEPRPERTSEWNRGAYLAEALAHCGECHTPRTFMGATNDEMYFAGSAEGPEGQIAPNITPDEATGIGSWSVPDIVWFLQTGFKPDGDGAQRLMDEVVEHGYQHLEESDLKAIAVYLKSLEPIENAIRSK
ncbi:MAG TPA: cytochrome c [Vicinamibacteria bacterium]|nr:cytochrome c [Vicinamibacteria bacterium]